MMSYQKGNIQFLMSDDEEEEESKSQGQGHKNEVKAWKEHVYLGLDASIVQWCCQSTLYKLSTHYHCLVRREPDHGQADKLIIQETSESYSKEVKKVLDVIKTALDNMSKQSVSYTNEQKRLVDKFVEKHLEERTRDTELYVEEVQITVIGERYDKVDKTAHSLRVHLGQVQPTNRAGRQFSMEEIKSTNYETERKPYKNAMSSSYPHRLSTSHTFDDVDEKFSFEQKLSNGFTFKVYKASITRLDVDVIVNAANDNLMHGGGVARVISQAAGKGLDDESQDYIARKGYIKVTKNCETTAGRLPYKSVIHAVGPQWHDYYSASDKVKCMDDVYWTVFNVLDRCDKKGYRRVGIPAISAGIYGVPKVLCADMYVKAAVDFTEDRGRKCPKEIHFIDVDIEILKLVRKSVEKWKKDPQNIDQKYTVPEYLKVNNFRPSTWTHHGHRADRQFSNSNSQGIELSGRRNRTFDRQKSFENGDITDTTYKSKIEYFQTKKFRWGGVADNFVVGNAIDILIFKSEIDKVRNLDAIVCGLDKELTSKSFVSKALENAGGRKYAQGLEDMKRGIKDHQKKVNYVFKSEGGDLGVKFVLHWMNERVKTASRDEMASFREGIFQVLEQAKRWGLRTLAIPLIGTGDIQRDEYKLKRCCSALLHGICDFCAEQDAPSITDIHLINNSSQVCDIMVDVFKQGCESYEQLDPSSPRSGSSSPVHSNERKKSPGRGRDIGNDDDKGRSRNGDKKDSFTNEMSYKRTYTAEGKQDDTGGDEGDVIPAGRDQGQGQEGMDVNKQPAKTGNLIIIED